MVKPPFRDMLGMLPNDGYRYMGYCEGFEMSVDDFIDMLESSKWIIVIKRKVLGYERSFTIL